MTTSNISDVIERAQVLAQGNPDLWKDSTWHNWVKGLKTAGVKDFLMDLAAQHHCSIRFDSQEKTFFTERVGFTFTGPEVMLILIQKQFKASLALHNLPSDLSHAKYKVQSQSWTRDESGSLVIGKIHSSSKRAPFEQLVEHLSREYLVSSQVSCTPRSWLNGYDWEIKITGGPTSVEETTALVQKCLKNKP